jgi:phosphoribosylaminoimidazole-succinocarboxamide synthase
MTTVNLQDNTKLISEALPFCLTETQFTFGKKYQGKVRDTYDLGDKLLLITTDRQSAFDRVLAAVPYKGQVLNLTSAWWFEKTEHIIPNHVLTIPDPNVTIAKKCTVFPVEFVVRGYITGTTSTSLWTQYNKGVRHYCGHDLPEGLRKNQRLEQPLLTPTTKDALHDRPISPEEIIAEGLMTQADWEIASKAAMALFQFGMETAAKHGLILVDTKYEMGKDADGNIILVDEIHTPDSSRYWLAKSYVERFANAEEPENIDKEFLRLWFADHCDPYKDAVLPKAPAELIVTLSSRYIQLYEMITGTKFNFPNQLIPVNERIKRNVMGYLA